MVNKTLIGFHKFCHNYVDIGIDEENPIVLQYENNLVCQ